MAETIGAEFEPSHCVIGMLISCVAFLESEEAVLALAAEMQRVVDLYQEKEAG